MKDRQGHPPFRRSTDRSHQAVARRQQASICAEREILTDVARGPKRCRSGCRGVGGKSGGGGGIKMGGKGFVIFGIGLR